MFAEIEDTEIS